jgi:hypothetical protein
MDEGARQAGAKLKEAQEGETSAPLWPFPACPHTAEELFGLDGCDLWPRQGAENSIEPTDGRATNDPEGALR